MAAQGCGQKIIGAYCGTQPENLLVDTSVEGGLSRAGWSGDQREEANTQVLDAFVEAMEEDFQSTSRTFWKTIRPLQEREAGLSQVCFHQEEELLNLTEDIVS